MTETSSSESCKMTIAEMKAKIKGLEDEMSRNFIQISCLESKNASLRSEIRKLNRTIYEQDDLEHKILYLLTKDWNEGNEGYDLCKVGSRPDGTTWVECISHSNSLEEAKVKAAIEGIDVRVLKDEWDKKASCYRLGIGVFSLDVLSTVASDPL